MIKLRDVAKLADVSIATVSNVVNGRTQTMGAEILKRVQQAIDTLGYQPNRAAQLLKTGHTPLIGLLLPSLATPFWGWLSREVEIAAQAEYGYRILTGNTDRDPQREMSFLDDLLAHGIRGVIIVSPLLEVANLGKFIKRGLVALVHDQRSLVAERTVDYVSINHIEAMTIAVDHLIAKGHRRLAFATASGRSVSRLDKINGFLAAAKKAGLSGSAELIEGKSSIRYGDDEMPQLGRTIAEQIAARPAHERPTGIVAVNDMMAIGLIFGFQNCGLRVPEDVSVIGMDDLFISASISPGITSVRPPLAEMAKAMIGCIVRRLGDEKEEPQELIFSPRLVERGSVADLSGDKTMRVAPAKKRASGV